MPVLLFGLFSWLLQILAIALAIILALRWLNIGGVPSNAPLHSDKSALQLLAERYARGEIDDAEFERRRAALVRAST